MADERIDIEIKDSVAPSLAPKIREIATSTKEAHTAVLELKQRLASLNNSALNTLKQQISGLNSVLKANAGANTQLAAQQQKAALAALKQQQAQAKLNIAQTQGATAAARLATAQAQTTGASARAQAAQIRLAQLQSRVNQSARNAAEGVGVFIKRMIAIAGVTLTAGAIMRLADSFTILQNKLKIVATGEEGLTTLTERIFDVANRTRTEVEATAQSFTRFDLALKNLGGSQEETLRMTETINKMLIVSGATAEEASSALLQLSQGFNKGVLNGDEFRSVMELMPLAADAIAKQLGVTRGQLLKLAPEGKITAQVMRQAFASIAKDIDEKFNKTIPTIGQSLVVLKNKFVQTIGEINKQLGLSNAVATFFKFLGDHIREILVILTALGAALLVVFGPAIVGAISTATTAVWGFTAALLANPIGLIAVGITAAVAGIALFGDKVAVSSDGLVTLKDTALAVWGYIKDGFGMFADWIKAAWGATVEFISGKTSGWGKTVHDVLASIMAVGKVVINSYIALWIGGFNAIMNNWQLLPAALKDIFAEGINAIIELGKKVGLDKIIDLDKFQMKITGAAKNLGANIKDSMKAAFSVDYVGSAADALMSRARKIAEERKKAQQGKGGGLRGAGTYVPPPNDEAIKEAARRAKEMDKLNRSLDEELTILQRKQPLDYVENRMLQITNDLLDKKIKLTDNEAAAIREKLQLIQKERTANEAAKIAADLQVELKGLKAVRSERFETAQLAKIENDLKEKQIVLTDEQRNGIKALLGELQKQKTANALDEINREIDQQSKLLSVIGPQREIEQQMQQYENDLRQKGLSMTKEENALLREKLELMQQDQRISQEADAIYADTIGKRQQFKDTLEAIVKLQRENSEFTEADKNQQVTSILGNMGIDTTFTEAGLQAQYAVFQTFYDQLNQLRDKDLISERDYADAKKQIMVEELHAKLANYNQFFGTLAEMQGSNIRALAAIGKAAAIAQATINVYEGATKALAQGGVWGAIQMGAVLAVGFAQIAQMASTGFKDGGFTGNVGESNVAGVVHGGEFVLNAAATRANRPALEAMNSGGVLGNQINVYVEHDGSTAVDVQTIDESNIRIIARQEARQMLHQEGPGVIANDISNPNSRTSKAIGRNTESRRRR